MKAIFLLVVMMMLTIYVDAQEIYRWVDEKGTIHFADDFTLVPERYRNQIEKRAPSQIPSSPPGPSQTAPEDTRSMAESTTEKKDRLGRGEDWWRAKMKEWNDRLQRAQKNYDLLYSDLKKKEKELADALFKPDSLKRKLKAEIKGLEGKLKEEEKAREEAKKMVEIVLPKEAEETKADPAWLHPKD